MDVTLPSGVATVSGTPPAGGVPDVLAQLAGTDGTVAADAFAALLATLGLGAGGEATDVSLAADGQGAPDSDASHEAASTALAAQALGLLPQPAVSPIILTAGAGSGHAAVPPPSAADVALAGSMAKPAIDAPTEPVAASVEAASHAQPPAGAAEAAEAAQAEMPHQPRRAAASDAPVTTPAPATEAATTASTEQPVGAVTEGSTGSPASSHGGRQLPGDVKVDPPTRAHEASQRLHDAALAEASPEQPKAASHGDTAGLKIDEPSALLRRHEQAPTHPDVQSGGPRATGAESLTHTPRPTTTSAPQTQHSGASTAYRHAEAATLPETSRPLGRLPDGGEMRLEVSPEGLGPIEIRVAVRADAVQASLWTQQDHARAALEAHRPMLADALGRSSLRLEEFTVGVGQHHHAAQDDDRTPRRWANPLAAEPAAAPPTIKAPVRVRGLSLRA